MELLLIQILDLKMLHTSIVRVKTNFLPFYAMLILQKTKIHTTKFNYLNPMTIDGKWKANFCQRELRLSYSYSKLNVIFGRYWVFRSWGRISTTIGSTKLESYGSLEQAREEFEHIYEERTGNYFAEKRFVKYPGKYYKMDIDYGEEEEVRKLSENKIKSNLAAPVQDLIKLIFDVNMMKQMMLEFDLDMEKMPLGKLSSKQIKAAMNVLQEIAELIQKNGSSGQFVEASNRFYTYAL